MIAVDSNLLIYSHRADSELFAASSELVDSLRHQSAQWAIPWPCVHEFISIVTHPKIYNPATSIDQALLAVDSWLAGGNVHLLSESPGYFEKLRKIAVTAKSSGSSIHDARIAALCLHHGVRELWTADRDFLSFPQLKVRNPLINL
ncbi:MAG: PIN domain-containing protein [Verrucomicrobia bacterium]|nr:PIN domain-containing protein [Verrucomicrobiota bacterium]